MTAKTGTLFGSIRKVVTRFFGGNDLQVWLWISQQLIQLKRMNVTFSTLAMVFAACLIFANPASGDTVYDGIFAKGHAGQKLWVGAYWNHFLKKWQAFEKQGYRLVDFEVDDTGSRPKFSGVFEPGNYSPAAYIGRPWKDFHSQWASLEKKGYRIIDFETWVVNGKRVYGGIFSPGKYSPAAYIGKPWKDFHGFWQKMEKKGYALIDYEVYKNGNKWRYAGIFAPQKAPGGAWLGHDFDNFHQMYKQFNAANMGLIDLEVRHVKLLDHGEGYVTLENKVDKLVSDYLKKNDVPGVTVAVTKNGRLVLNKGYGYFNNDKRIPMRNYHRTRIGSVSKILTALGVMRLTELKKSWY